MTADPAPVAVTHAESMRPLHTDIPRVRPAEYDGGVTWRDYSTQVELVASLNNWDDFEGFVFGYAFAWSSTVSAG